MYPFYLMMGLFLVLALTAAVFTPGIDGDRVRKA